MYRSILASIALTFAISLVAEAQGLRLNPVTTQTTTITGSCLPDVDVTVRVTHRGFKLDLAKTNCKEGSFKTDLAFGLHHGDTVTLLQQLTEKVTNSFSQNVRGDAREDFEASAFLGFAIDTFATDEINRYLNQTANGKPQERGIFGFDFAYRLVDQDATVKGKNWNPQIWVYGETIHGTRSGDVDCARNPDFPTCLSATADLLALGKAIPSNALYMLRNATSLEGFVGVRAELLTLNITGNHPAALYLKGQLGFITVAGSDGDAKDAHHWALGLTTTGGRLQGSYFEVGHGRTDLFATNRYRRYKFDGYLQHKILNKPFYFFGQIVADVDMGPGADAIQPYFGLTFDLDALFTPGRVN
jgi:hypothetical protein